MLYDNEGDVLPHALKEIFKGGENRPAGPTNMQKSWKSVSPFWGEGVSQVSNSVNTEVISQEKQ